MRSVGIVKTLLALFTVTGGWFCRIEAQDIRQIYARGVYWPWEKTASHAAKAGMDEWQFVDHFMKQIKEQWHCNVVWFVNGPGEREKICRIAEKYGVKVLCGTDFAGLFAHGLQNTDQLDELAKSTVAKVSGSSAFGAYVLKDEPGRKDLQLMNECRKRLEQLDPKRPSMVVTMSQDTEAYIYNSDFPVICSDIYYFGGPRSPNIPNSPKSSKHCYSGAAYDLASQCHDRRKIAWIMPQSFTEVWGPWWLDEKENLVIGKGSYYHWRNPVPAEIRWQIWEAVRAGIKGVVFFSPLLGADNRENWQPGKGEMPERMKKKLKNNKSRRLPVVKETLNTGLPRSLTYSDGRSTPQGDAMGEVFGKLEKIEPILRELTLAAVPFFFAEAPGRSASFSHHRHRQFIHYYAVVINNDTEKTQDITCFVPGLTEKVIDAVTGAALSVTAAKIDSGCGMKQVIIKLGPGDGGVFKLEMKGRPGVLALSETFNGRAPVMELVNCSRRLHQRGFGMGLQWKVTRGEACPVDKEAYILIDKLHDKKHSGLAQSLEAIDKSGEMVMLKIDGTCPATEDIVVSYINAKGEVGWNKTSEYQLPLVIPADTRQIKVLLKERGAIFRISLWRTKK
jgi:hypothetical protein